LDQSVLQTFDHSLPRYAVLQVLLENLHSMAITIDADLNVLFNVILINHSEFARHFVTDVVFEYHLLV
jgi:hypothetical protein